MSPGPVSAPTIVTVSSPAPPGKVIVMVTSTPFTVPLGMIETTGESSPTHCDKSLGQTTELAAPVNVDPVRVKFVKMDVWSLPFAEVRNISYRPVRLEIGRGHV